MADVQRANGSEGSGQSIALGPAAGHSKSAAPALKVLQIEFGELSIKMTFAESRGDGENDTPGGNLGPG